MLQTSFVIPVRNGARFIGQALDSLLHQTDSDLEVIVVDDGSTDGTIEIVQLLAHEDDRVRLVHNPSVGLAAALNQGLAEARGSLIGRLDADDFAEPARLEAEVAYLAEHADVAVVGTAVTLIDPDGRTFGHVDYPTRPEDIAARLLVGNCIAHPSVLMRREIVLAAGGYRSVFPHAEDYDLWLRLSDTHKLANLPARMTRYRVHMDQVTTRKLRTQAISALGARLVTLRRRNGECEMLPDGEIDQAFLAQLGARRDQIAAAVATAALERASVTELNNVALASEEVAGVAHALSVAGDSTWVLDRRLVRYALTERRPARAAKPLMRAAAEALRRRA